MTAPADGKPGDAQAHLLRYASSAFDTIGLIAIVMSAGFLAYLLISMMRRAGRLFPHRSHGADRSQRRSCSIRQRARRNADAALATVNGNTDRAAEDNLAG